MQKIKLKLIKSLSGSTDNQKQCVRGLGLRKLNSTSDLSDTPEVRGMLNKVSHLVQVQKN